MYREPKRDHVLREALIAALKDQGIDAEQIADIVLRTLDQQRMISYAPAGELPLLTTHGRTLVAIMEDPGITLRALAVYLGISESNAQKSVKALLDKGLIAKTKLKNSSKFIFGREVGFTHPDISRLFDGIVNEIRRRSIVGLDIHAPKVDDPPF